MSKEKRWPSFLFDVQAFLSSSDVQAMEAHEVGAYVLLLANMWDQPDQCYMDWVDEDLVRRIGKLSTEQWKTSRKIILKKFKLVHPDGSQHRVSLGHGKIPVGSRLINCRQLAEFTKLTTTWTDKSGAGAQGAEKRWKGHDEKKIGEKSEEAVHGVDSRRIALTMADGCKYELTINNINTFLQELKAAKEKFGGPVFRRSECELVFAALNEEDFAAAWTQWFEYRLRKKKAYKTLIGPWLALVELASAQRADALAALHKAIKNEYQGFHITHGTAKPTPKQGFTEAASKWGAT